MTTTQSSPASSNPTPSTPPSATPQAPAPPSQAQPSQAQPNQAQPNQASPVPATPSAAGDLRNLASRRGLAGRRAELESLANALEHQTDADRWARTDLLATFVQDESFKRPLQTWIGRGIDIVVQVFFFMPIFITWLGLLEATRAYRETVHSKSVANETFIQGWQNGFAGHLSSGFYLDDIARDVVIVIGVLVGLLIAQTIFRSLVEEDQVAKLRLDLVKALVAADLQLTPHRSDAPSQATAELRRAAAEIKKTATSIRTVGDTARQTQTAAKASLDAAAGGVAKVSAAMAKADAAMAKVDALAQAVTAAAGQVGSSSAALEQRLADMNATTSTIVSAQTEFVRKIAQSGAQLTSSADGLAKRLSDAVRASQQDMASASDSSAAKIVTALETGADQIRSALTEISVAGAGYAHRVEQAADIIGQAGDSVNALPGLIASFQAGVSNLGDRLSDLEHAITLAKAVVPRPNEIPPGLGEALADLRVAATALESASAALLRTDRRAQGRQPTYSSPQARTPREDGGSGWAPGRVTSPHGPTDPATRYGPGDLATGPGDPAGRAFNRAGGEIDQAGGEIDQAGRPFDQAPPRHWPRGLRWRRWRRSAR